MLSFTDCNILSLMLAQSCGKKTQRNYTFIYSNYTGLRTTAEMTSGALLNICNLARRVDIATLYMIHFLGKSTEYILMEYTFNLTANYIYPGSNDMIPKNLKDYPNLEQGFWTVVTQVLYKSYMIKIDGIRLFPKRNIPSHNFQNSNFKPCRNSLRTPWKISEPCKEQKMCYSGGNRMIFDFFFNIWQRIKQKYY